MPWRPLLPAPQVADLRRNAPLFALLVLVNGFVGAMVGLERTLVPLLGAEEFGLASKAAVLSFIATFGLAKAFTNLAAGAWADAEGRRKWLVRGWLVALPVPLLLYLAPAPHWWLVLAANVLLGVNQGLCWSMAVVMKVDLAGERRRGLALGLNEFAGYAAVAAAAFATGALAASWGPRLPLLLGLVVALAGLALSALLVPETAHLAPRRAAAPPALPLWRRGADFARLSWQRRDLLALHQAGLVNNLNDGLAWGLFPLLFATVLNDIGQLGLLVALYPLTWGLAQLLTGPLSDRTGRPPLIVLGMAVQGVALVAVALLPGWWTWAAAMVLLGAGTALVYPTLLGAVADAAPPGERATTLGVYRFWRDLGFAVGALGGGALADLAGVPMTIVAVGLITLLAAVPVAAARRRGRFLSGSSDASRSP